MCPGCSSEKKKGGWEVFNGNPAENAMPGPGEPGFRVHTVVPKGVSKCAAAGASEVYCTGSWGATWTRAQGVPPVRAIALW